MGTTARSRRITPADIWVAPAMLAATVVAALAGIGPRAAGNGDAEALELAPAAQVARSADAATAAAVATTDLCAAMEAAGAQTFAGHLLQVGGAAGDREGLSAARRRRCAFHGYRVGGAAPRQLLAAISSIEIPLEGFELQARAASRVPGRRAWSDPALGRAGYGWIDPDDNEVELHYLLPSGRQLKVRWSGAGTQPDTELDRLRAFAARLAAQLE